MKFMDVMMEAEIALPEALFDVKPNVDAKKKFVTVCRNKGKPDAIIASLVT